MRTIPRPVAGHVLRPDRTHSFAAVKALLIDIDDTIVVARGNCDPLSPPSTGSLMNVLQQAGVRLGGLSAAQTAERLQKVQREVRWWHWSDFIVALELNPKEFWEFAYESERPHVQATGPEIHAALKRLRDAGFLLYVTSNNPSSGILHKLRLAGLGNLQGCDLFSQLLGATELHAMKWETQYWKKALAHIGLDAGEVAVIGDNLRDDWEVPHSIGIPCTFLINRQEDLSALDEGGLIHVQDFGQIADRLLAGR